MAASAVIAVGAATAALPDTVGAGAGSAGASRLVLRSASVPPTTVGTMAARIPPTGRLRHAPPLGDQPLGSSRLAVDSRLLLGVPFDNSRPASHAEGSGFACQPSGVT